MAGVRFCGDLAECPGKSYSGLLAARARRGMATVTITDESTLGEKRSWDLDQISLNAKLPLLFSSCRTSYTISVAGTTRAECQCDANYDGSDCSSSNGPRGLPRESRPTDCHDGVHCDADESSMARRRAFCCRQRARSGQRCCGWFRPRGQLSAWSPGEWRLQRRFD